MSASLLPREIAGFVITVSHMWISARLTAGQKVFSHHGSSNRSRVFSQGQLIQTGLWSVVWRRDPLLVMSSGPASSSRHCGVLNYTALMKKRCEGSFTLLQLRTDSDAIMKWPSGLSGKCVFGLVIIFHARVVLVIKWWRAALRTGNVVLRCKRVFICF